ncbi:MAG: aminotransferase class I/II-fold pyridoxal phosphate-dependent enzyme [Flavobacteriales bacterium]
MQAKEAALEKIKVLKAERQKLITELQNIPSVKTIYPSDANFLLVRFPNADALYQQLTDKGIIVRNRSKELHCDNCLRITVGTPNENQRLIQALQQLSQ